VSYALATASVLYSKLRIDVQGVVLPSPTRFGRSTRILLTLGIASGVTAGLFLRGPAAFAQLGAQTAPANLDVLTQQAATILRGTVVSAAIEPHPQFSNIQTVTVAISVARVLKGESSKIFTFRQFVWDPREAAAAPGYCKGGELLLHLPKKCAQKPHVWFRDLLEISRLVMGRMQCQQAIA
jgi:hypothetical protein